MFNPKLPPPSPLTQADYWYTRLSYIVTNANTHSQNPPENILQNFINDYSYNFLQANAPILVKGIQEFLIRPERDSFQIFLLLNLIGTLMSRVGEPFIRIFGYDFGELVPTIYKKLPNESRLEIISKYFPIWSYYYSPLKISRTQEFCMEISNQETIQIELSEKAKALEAAESKIKSLETAKKELKFSTMDCFEHERTHLKEQIKILETEVTNLTSEANESEKDYKLQISRLQSDLQEKSELILQQKKCILEFSEIIDKSDSKIQENQVIIFNLLKKVENLESKLSLKENEVLDLKDTTAQIQKLKQQVEFKSQELTTQRKINDATFEEIEKNEKETEERCKEIVDLQKKIGEKESMVRKCNLTNAQQNAKIIELKGRLGFYENESKITKNSDPKKTTNTEYTAGQTHIHQPKKARMNPQENQIKYTVKVEK